MSYLFFEIPERFLYGLATGALQRYGTIIKDVKTGQIVAHIREVFSVEDLKKLQQSINNLGNKIKDMQTAQQLMAVGIKDIQSAQKLMAAGIGAIAVISVVGFMCLAKKTNSLQPLIKELNESAEKIKQEIQLIRLENALSLTKNYYRAVAAFKESQFEESCRCARECSADIENYLLNIPVNDLLVDERKLEFLIKFLLSAMRCQIEASRQLPDSKIHLIHQRYMKLFKDIELRLNDKKKKSQALLPVCKDDLAILKNFSRPSSFTNRLLEALPACQEVLESGRAFLELGANDKIYQGKIDNRECMVVLTDSYKREQAYR